jgi:hypothetical protein
LESSKDKTVRNMINNLCSYQWLYQYSIFVDVNLNEIDDAKDIAIKWLITFDDIKFKDHLRKRNSETAMFYVLRKTIHRNHPSNIRFPQYYITIFTTNALIGMKPENIQKYLDYPINVTRRKVYQHKILSTCNALKSQNLHDLSSLGVKKRFTILNRKKLIASLDQS